MFYLRLRELRESSKAKSCKRRQSVLAWILWREVCWCVGRPNSLSRFCAPNLASHSRLSAQCSSLDLYKHHTSLASKFNASGVAKAADRLSSTFFCHKCAHIALHSRANPPIPLCSAGCGKSTFAKQLKILYTDGTRVK